MVQYVFMLIGFLVTALNVLTFIALRRRLLHAFPKRGNLVSIVVGVAMLVLLHPGLFMLFGGVSGMMSFREQVPEWAQITAMTFQLATWVYGGVLLIKGTPAAFIDAFKRLRRLARKPDGTPAEREIVNEERRKALAKAALALPAAIVATAVGAQSPRARRLW
ncbi:MAG: hypothetical protein M5U25_17285 [Planctomycetota bacterium]|nr:hypothetical protein [Planctomycetota bacterium]